MCGRLILKIVILVFIFTSDYFLCLSYACSSRARRDLPSETSSSSSSSSLEPNARASLFSASKRADRERERERDNRFDHVPSLVPASAGDPPSQHIFNFETGEITYTGPITNANIDHIKSNPRSRMISSYSSDSRDSRDSREPSQSASFTSHQNQNLNHIGSSPSAFNADTNLNYQNYINSPVEKKVPAPVFGSLPIPRDRERERDRDSAPILVSAGGSGSASDLVPARAKNYRLQQGEKCDPAVGWCDYGAWIYCHREASGNGICDCLHPKRQVFDGARERCVSIPGTECNVYIGERDCVENSFCSFNRGNGQSLCKCKAGFEREGVKCKSQMPVGSLLESSASLNYPRRISAPYQSFPMSNSGLSSSSSSSLTSGSTGNSPAVAKTTYGFGFGFGPYTI